MRFQGRWRKRALYTALLFLAAVLFVVVDTANSRLGMRHVRVDVPVQLIDAQSRQPVNGALVLLIDSCSPPDAAKLDEAIGRMRDADLSRPLEDYDLSSKGGVATVSLTSRTCEGSGYASAAIRLVIGRSRPFVGCRWVVVDKPGYERAIVDVQRGRLTAYDGLRGTLVLAPVSLTRPRNDGDHS